MAPSPKDPALPSAAASSQQMPPAQMSPAPASSSSSPSVNVLPSNRDAVYHKRSSSSHSSFQLSGIPSGQARVHNSSAHATSGPTRHPRPLNAADLHNQLEREQESIINHLTRELSILRAAQNASVVSDTSSTSAATPGGESVHASDLMMASGPGFSHPVTGGRRQRTCSNTSTRSITAHAGSISSTSLAGGISSPAPVRPGNPASGIGMSRQNSSTSRLSHASSPVMHPAQGPAPQQPMSGHSYTSDPFFQMHAAHHHSSAQTPSPGATGGPPDLSPGILPPTPRLEETAFWRAELDRIMTENEALKSRVRQLERIVRERRASDASPRSHARNDSGSTLASVSAAASTADPAKGSGAASQREGRDRPRVPSALGVPDNEVRVGESAASSALTPSQ